MDHALKIQHMLEEDERFYAEENARLAREHEHPRALPSASLLIAKAQAKPSSPAFEQPLGHSVLDADTLEIADPIDPIHIPHRNKLEHFPAFMARSALFKAGRIAGAGSVENLALPAQGCKLTVSGPRLTMRDKIIWETAIQIAKETSPDMSKPFEISLRNFARRMGDNDTCGAALSSIWDSLLRLSHARVEFSIPGSCAGVGSMLSTAIKRADRFYLRINPDFALPAMTGDKQFRIRSQRRRGLSTALAQWLHDFFSTHQTTRDMDLGYLRGLCGYDGAKRNFPAKLRAAMEELSKKLPDVIASFAIDRIGKDGDTWMLKVTKGPEKPEFVMPKIAAKTSRHNGVAL